MPIKKSEDKKISKKTVKAAKKPAGLTVPVYNLEGTESGTIELPKNLFAAKINEPLLAQALRVYLNNLKAHFSNTKTRSEVKYSTRKIRVQKGTGGARHGSLGAPIFVGGGIALGPKFRKVMLDLPKKMKKAALIAALSSKAKAGEIIGVSGLDKVSGKTAQVKKLADKVSKKNTLLVVEVQHDNILRAVRNLPNIKILTPEQLNALIVVSHQTVAFTKEAVTKLEERIK